MEPDYKSYSIEELQEALSAIDTEAFPERTTRIRTEMLKRKPVTNITHSDDSDSLETKQANQKIGTGRQIFILLVSALFIYWGVEAIIDGEVAGRRGRTLTIENSPLLYSLRVSVYIVCGGFFAYIAIAKRFKKTNAT